MPKLQHWRAAVGGPAASVVRRLWDKGTSVLAGKEEGPGDALGNADYPSAIREAVN